MVLRSDGQPLGIGGYCFYCGRPIRLWTYQKFVRPPDDAVTADHIVPKCRGGTKLVNACFGCNQDKKDLSLDEFRLIRAFRSGMIQLPEYKFAAEI